MLQIRALAADDSIVALTGVLHRAYARLGRMGLNYTAVDQPPQVTAERVSGGQCFVADDDGALVGTIVVQPPYEANECAYFARPGVAALHQFAVDPASQGRGIGRALLQAAERWARAQGFLEVALDTAEQAEHLIGLYERLGYERVGTVRRAGKVYRSVVLRKALGPAVAGG